MHRPHLHGKGLGGPPGKAPEDRGHGVRFGRGRAATAKYGPIDCWDVSGVTDMSQLFYNLQWPAGFNEDISGWDTSRVTTMRAMFAVRCSPRPNPKPAVSRPLACTHRALLATLGRERRPSTSRCVGTPPGSRTWTACFTCAAPPLHRALPCAAPRAPPPPSQSLALSSVHTLRAPRSRPYARGRRHARRPSYPARPSLHFSAVRAGVQPAAKLGHLPRHGHGLNV